MLIFRKLTNSTFVTEQEKVLPGNKPMKDRLSLLMCGSASGDFKVKLLLVYHSDNPRVFTQNNVMKRQIACNVEGRCKGLGYWTISLQVDA